VINIEPPVTYRRDRFGECWHLIPDGALGPRSRTLCGQPRQGTALSETYADIQPAEPDCICASCTTAYRNLTTHEVAIKQAPTTTSE
jgi:hypothetical protein